jgi:tRNA splicing endonuclease
MQTFFQFGLNHLSFSLSKNQEENRMDQNNDRIMNAESLNIDATLEKLSNELKPDETLILDVGNNYFDQTDTIYDTLVMKGYDVRKSFKNGRNQILVTKRQLR